MKLDSAVFASAGVLYNCQQTSQHRRRSEAGATNILKVEAQVSAETAREERLFETVNGHRVRHRLDEARLRVRRNDAVRAQLEWQARAQEDVVHGRDQLHRKLLLRQAVARLYDHRREIYAQ